eukprot:TRINITY_DN4936_c0_g1_i2.p1 TRINITY_DN4936_c0_g1~~TRINITY_DN4936_c0_g1_i2.p1  ORF type:complete len:444 (-),score=80.36 TRINITY_DN4936_c0_g1_i2:76-1407(-)
MSLSSNKVDECLSVCHHQSLALESLQEKIIEDAETSDEKIASMFESYLSCVESHLNHALEQLSDCRSRSVKSLSSAEDRVISKKSCLRIQLDLQASTTQPRDRFIGSSIYKSLFSSLALDSISTQGSLVHSVQKFHTKLPIVISKEQDLHSKLKYVFSGLYAISTQIESLVKCEQVKTTGGPDQSFSYPNGLAVCQVTGNIYVADCCNDNVKVFDENLQYITSIGEEYGHRIPLRKPIAVALTADGQILLIVDQEKNRIVFVRVQDFQVIEIRGGESDAKHTFSEPWFVSTDCEDNFYISDRKSKRILKYSRAGELVLVIDRTVLPRMVQPPYGIVISDDERILVVPEGGYNVIQQYTLDGKFLGDIPCPTIGASCMFRGPHGGFGVSDWSNDKVYFFNQAGQMMKEMVVKKPVGAAFGVNGKFYIVSQDANHSVICYDGIED